MKNAVSGRGPLKLLSVAVSLLNGGEAELPSEFTPARLPSYLRLICSAVPVRVRARGAGRVL